MVDQPQVEESGVSKPTYKTDETAKAFTTLLNKETASNEQLEPETTENKDVCIGFRNFQAEEEKYWREDVHRHR